MACLCVAAALLGCATQTADPRIGQRFVPVDPSWSLAIPKVDEPPVFWPYEGPWTLSTSASASPAESLPLFAGGDAIFERQGEGWERTEFERPGFIATRVVALGPGHALALLSVDRDCAMARGHSVLVSLEDGELRTLFEREAFSVSSLWASGPEDIWFAGAEHFGQPRFVHGQYDAPRFQISHFDGQRWHEHRAGDPELAAAWVFGTGPGDVWLLSSWHALRYDGEHYTEHDYPVSVSNIVAAAGVEGDMWVLDAHGELMHWDGLSFTHQPLPEIDDDANTKLVNLAYFGPNEVWAVGQAGLLRRYDGERWTAEPLSQPVSLVSVARDEHYLFGLTRSRELLVRRR